MPTYLCASNHDILRPRNPHGPTRAVLKKTWAMAPAKLPELVGKAPNFQGSNIFHPFLTLLRMMFLFPRWDMLVSGTVYIHHYIQIDK